MGSDGETRPDLVVVGECPRDILLDFEYEVDRPGGAVYSAIISAALGGGVGIVGDLGTDSFSSSTLQSLSKWGIDTAGVEQLSGPTPEYRIRNCSEITPQVVTPRYHRYRPSRSSHFPTHYQRARALLMYPYDQGILTQIAEQVSENGGTTYFDLQHDVTSIETWKNVIQASDTVFASHNELMEISGEADLTAAARSILTYGPNQVVVKFGLGGSLIFSRDGDIAPVNCYQSRFVCTVGAGDAYNAAFAISELRGADSIASGEFASLVASLFVEKITIEDVESQISDADWGVARTQRNAVFVSPAVAKATSVYLAGHFLSTPARSWTRTIAAALETRGFSVFVPHRDGGILSHRSLIAERAGVFRADRNAIEAADLIVALLDSGGRGGTSWELGYASAHDKPVLGILTDQSHPLSNMIYQSCYSISGSPQQLLNEIYELVGS